MHYPSEKIRQAARSICLKQVILVCLLGLLVSGGIVLPGQAQQPDTILIQDAIAQGRIEAWAEPQWSSFRQPSLLLTVRLLSGEGFLLDIPAGTILQADDPGMTDVVVCEARQELLENSLSLELVALSTSHAKGPPSRAYPARYALSGTNTGTLIELLGRVGEQVACRQYGAQLAVWAWQAGMTPDDLAAQLPARPSQQDMQLAWQLFGEPVEPIQPIVVTEPAATQIIQIAQPEPLMPTQPPAEKPSPKSATGSSSGRLTLLIILGTVIVAAVLVTVTLSLAGRKAAHSSGQIIPIPHDQRSPRKEVPPPRPAPKSEEPRVPVIKRPKPAISPAPRKDTPSFGTVYLLGISGPLSGRRYEATLPAVISRGFLDYCHLKDPTIETPHAAFDLSTPPFRVKDLASQSGVTVDGERLGAKFVDLQPGQSVLVGKSELHASEDGLKIIAGPSAGEEFPNQGNVIVLTSKPLTQVTTGEDDRRISDAHASLYVENETVVIRDLNSSNGVFLNGTRLISPAALKNGDRLGLGNSLLQVE